MMTDTAPFNAAPQHGPRPLPLFLELLRNETAASPDRREAALKGLRAYQDAPRSPRAAAMPEVARIGRACLRDYGGSGRPTIFVPSLINPPFVLDLAPHNSMLRWMAAQGVRPLLLDWGTPGPEDRDLGVARHVESLLVPLFDALGEPAALAGYCLGGTMAVAAASLRPVAGVALIAAPWRFSGFSDAARADIAGLWDAARPAAEALGYLPMEVLQAGFWRLDPARTVSKYEHFGTLDSQSPEAEAFVALEDWANGGAPVPLAAGREMLEDFFAADLPGAGGWSVGGRAIDPLALQIPLIDIVSLTDRIVPAKTATGHENRLELRSGHVGMVVGQHRQEALWKPLLGWLRAL